MSGNEPCPDESEVEDSLLDLLPADRCRAVRRHVEECERCRRMHGPTVALVRDLRAGAGRLDELAAEGALVKDIVAQLSRAVDPSRMSDEGKKPTDAGLDEPRIVSTGAVTRDDGAPLRRVGNYELLELIGQGGMGRVYRARHCRMDRVVALKILPDENAHDAEMVARFHREVQAAAKLIHPNIVTAFDADESDGQHFLVMEYIQGVNLAELVARRGPCAVGEAIQYTLDAARGLEFAHRHGVVHRDIKPSNLVLDERGIVRILDMGLARIQAAGTVSRQSDLTGTGTVMGTVDFIAPEQALNAKSADTRSDIYSLGVTLWYLLNGSPMYGGDSVVEKLMAHQVQPIPALAEQRSDVPCGLGNVFARMVAKKPADRYQSMAEVVRALESFVPGNPIDGGRASSVTAPAGARGVRPFRDEDPVQIPSAAVRDAWAASRVSSNAAAMQNTIPLIAATVDTSPIGVSEPDSLPACLAIGRRKVSLGRLAILVGSLATLLCGAALATRFAARVGNAPATVARSPAPAAGQPQPLAAVPARTDESAADGPAAGRLPEGVTDGYPQSMTWNDVTASFAPEMVALKRAELDDGGLRITRNGFAADINGGQEYRDVAVRITGSGSFYPYVRRFQKRLRYSAAGEDGGSVALVDEDKALKTARGISGPGFDRHAEHEMVLMAKGDEITLWIDGVRRATLRDATNDRGSIGFGAWGDDVGEGRVRIRKVECAELSTAVPVATSQPMSVDPASTDEDFPFQGEYAGSIVHDGQSQRYGAQVVARGDGMFDLVFYPGGLPGDGWSPSAQFRGTGTRRGTAAQTRVMIEGLELAGRNMSGEIRGGTLLMLDEDGSDTGRLPRVERKSPTLGQSPPAGAIVIFDGSGPIDEATTLRQPRITADGLLMEGVTTANLFGDAQWHVEFRIPYQPAARGQSRGNSGIFVNGGYELNILDSFGLEPNSKECGSVFDVAAPRVNMCLPPLTWQTYDIDFTSPRFEAGRKMRNARMTVRHNGVVIHENVEVPANSLGSGLKTEQSTGPLHLQNYESPVRYRNIWVVPKP